MNTLQWMMGFIRWEVGDGFKIKIGLDAIMGMIGNHTLSLQLLNFRHKKYIILLQTHKALINNYRVGQKT